MEIVGFGLIPSWLTATGAALVLLSVAVMPFADHIQQVIFGPSDVKADLELQKTPEEEIFIEGTKKPIIVKT